MFEDIIKKPAEFRGIVGFCEDCINGHFHIAGANQVVCQIKGVTVDRKHSCVLFAPRILLVK